MKTLKKIHVAKPRKIDYNKSLQLIRIRHSKTLDYLKKNDCCSVAHTHGEAEAENIFTTTQLVKGLS